MKTRNPLRRIGIFGGSFDPPHSGHLILAQSALNQLRLDKVIFLPAYRAPHKRGKRPTSAASRFRMSQLAVSGNARFEVSDIEIRRKGVSYTHKTVAQISRDYPEAKLFLIIGGDNFAQFHTWKMPDEILRLASLAVYRRSGEVHTQPRRFSKNILLLRGPLVNISSSEIRSRVEMGKTIRYLVPEKVRKFIASRKLYGS